MERTWCKPLPPADLLIRGGRVVDPLSGTRRRPGRARRPGQGHRDGQGVAAPKGVREVDAAGMLVLPGFVDLHTHLRTPGREDEEDVASGTLAAAAGGYVARLRAWPTPTR